MVIGTPVSHDAAATPEELIRICEEWIENTQFDIQGVGPFAPVKLQEPTPIIPH